MEAKKYVCSFSGGKDSMATIILAHEHKEPLDEIIFSEVMFDEKISGEYPEQIDFINNVCRPQFEDWGYKLKIVRSKTTFMDCFFHVVTKSHHPERNGKIAGFPMGGKCKINSVCKVPPIHEYYKENPDVIQYIGIAADERERESRMKPNQVSLLCKYNYTEADAKALCEKNGLLSPVYSFTHRGGCFFCPNATKAELRYLYDKHPNLFQSLLNLEQQHQEDAIGHCFDTRKKRYLKDVLKQIKEDKAQLLLFED